MWHTDASHLEKEGKVEEGVTEIKRNSGKHHVERAEAERNNWLPATSSKNPLRTTYVFEATSTGPTTGCSDPPIIAETHVCTTEHARPKNVFLTQYISSTCVKESVIMIDTNHECRVE